MTSDRRAKAIALFAFTALCAAAHVARAQSMECSEFEASADGGAPCAHGDAPTCDDHGTCCCEWVIPLRRLAAEREWGSITRPTLAEALEARERGQANEDRITAFFRGATPELTYSRPGTPRCAGGPSGRIPVSPTILADARAITSEATARIVTDAARLHALAGLERGAAVLGLRAALTRVRMALELDAALHAQQTAALRCIESALAAGEEVPARALEAFDHAGSDDADDAVWLSGIVMAPSDDGPSYRLSVTYESGDGRLIFGGRGPADLSGTTTVARDAAIAYVCGTSEQPVLGSVEVALDDAGNLTFVGRGCGGEERVSAGAACPPGLRRVSSGGELGCECPPELRFERTGLRCVEPECSGGSRWDAGSAACVCRDSEFWDPVRAACETDPCTGSAVLDDTTMACICPGEMTVWSSTSEACECGGRSSWDTAAGECVCPPGTVADVRRRECVCSDERMTWSDAAGTCACAGRATLDAAGGSCRCPDTHPLWVSGECLACVPGMIWNGHECDCAPETPVWSGWLAQCVTAEEAHAEEERHDREAAQRDADERRERGRCVEGRASDGHWVTCL